jgi:hypothetical protein
MSFKYLRVKSRVALYVPFLLFLTLIPNHNSSASNSDGFTRIRINDTELAIEVAATEEQRMQGLMGRSTLSEGTGMLFIFERPQILSFWMKNTIIPLSIGFFDKNHCLINIEDMDPPKNGELRLYKSKKPALYALEVPQGWFERHQIHFPMRFLEVQ